MASEAAGYAMGLVKLGSSAEDCSDEMLQYAHETQHEKIIRGLAIGVAFIYYGKQEQADSIIEKLLADKVCRRAAIIRTKRCIMVRTPSSDTEVFIRLL